MVFMNGDGNKLAKKFMITIDDDSVNIDKVHDAISKITKEYFTTWEEDEQELRTQWKVQ